MLDKTMMDVGQNYDGLWTKLQQMLDETTMNVEQNYDERRTKLQQTSDGTNGRTNDNYVDNDVVNRSMSMNFVAMAFKRKKRILFFSISCFFNFLFLFLLLELLQGLFTTWLQAQKHTRMHSLDANLKTHVQGK
jgi:hypothetical protein